MAVSTPFGIRHSSFKSRLRLYDVPQYIRKHFRRALVCIDPVHQMFAVKTQHRLGFFFVGLEPLANHVKARVVEPVFFQRAPLHSLDQIVQILAAQIKYPNDIQRVLEHLGLMLIPGDAVQDERVLVRPESPGLGVAFDGLPPEVDRRLVGDQFTAAGKINEDAADLAVNSEIPEDIAAGAMQKVRNRAQNFPLRALARSGRAEKKYGTIFHASLISNYRIPGNSNAQLSFKTTDYLCAYTGLPGFP